MSHHDDNLYTILGRLAALQPKPEIKTSKEAAKKIYESVEARGSILSGVDTVQAKLAKQFAMERDESKLKKGHCSDCDCSPCRCKKCNECGVLESKCRCKPDMTEGAVKDSLYMELSRVARDKDYPKLSELMSDSGTVGRYLQQQIEEITSETGLHPDDDFEEIETQLMARLQRDFGDDDEMEEGWKQTLRLVDPTIKARILGKAQDQTNQGLDTIQHLADLDLTSDDMVSRAMKPNTYFRNAERYAKLANKGMEEGVAEGLGTSPDRLLARTGMNNAHKFPRDGQTNLGNIPGMNTPDASPETKAYADQQRANRPGDLKAAIRGQLGKHHEPNLPEQDVEEGDEAAVDINQLASQMKFLPTRKKILKYNFIPAGQQMTPLSYRLSDQDGELIKTITSTDTADKPETKNVALKGDVVMSGPSGENYVVKGAKFGKLYDGNVGGIVYPEQSPRMVALYTGQQSVTFTAPWGESMKLEPDDYLVKDSDAGYYRIAKAEYKQTYNEPGQQGVAEGEKVVKGNVTTHTGTYGNEYQGDPDDDAKAPKVSNSKTGKRGRPTKDEKDTLQAKLPWGGKPPKDTYKPDSKGHEHRMSDEPPKGSPERAAWDEKQARKNNRKPKSIKEEIDSVERRLTEGVNLLELLKEKHQTVDEMLAELSTDIANFKESGHCSELLKDCMDIKGAHKKAQPFTALDIAPAHAITPAATRLPHQFNAPPMEMKMDRELNELARLAGLSEDCGDMPPIGIAMQDMQSEQDNLSISTTYNSRDGKKTISVNADGKQAEDLLQMLRIAGLGSGEKAQELQARTEIEFDNIDGEVSTVPQDDLEELSNEQSPMILGGPGDAEMDEAEFDVPATEPVNGPKPEYQTMKQSTMGPGEGDPGEKAMHPDRATNNNGDNALSTPATPPTRAQKTLIAVSTLESKLAAEYESIKKSK